MKTEKPSDRIKCDDNTAEKPVDAASPCSPPDVLWLQYHGDSDPDEWTDEEPGGVTWCGEKIFEHDVEYVRADLVRELLKGHQCSELLGMDGLIAATMRAFEANTQAQATQPAPINNEN